MIDIVAGDVFTDTSGSRYRALEPWKASGMRGWRGVALGGSHLTLTGAIYAVPFERFAEVNRCGFRPAGLAEASRTDR